MNETKQTISKLLVAVADALNSMDDREFDLLIHGEGSLRFVSALKNGARNRKKPDHDPELKTAVSHVAHSLSLVDSREDAHSLIASINQPKRKDFLVLLAKACGVRIESKDTISRIEHKLIESVVGTRLRSKAFKEVAF